MIESEICRLLDIRYPILQGGMAWIADSHLAAAVSEAGGLGIISAMNASVEYLKEQIDTARTLTSRPFGVNVMLMSPHAPAVAEVLAEKKVPVVTTGAGNPSRYIQMWKDAGIKVIPVVPSVATARMVARAGADAVIAEGGESGGHIGEMNTMALIPQVCDAVDIPVIAAGGIGDGRGLAAALMLGACGIQMGTRFLVASECGIHQNYKNKVLKASDIDTIVTGRRLGHPVRSLKTRFTREYSRMESDSEISDEKLEGLAVGALRLAAVDGDNERGCFIAGEIAGLIKKEQTSAEMIREIMEQSEILLRGTKWVK
ncbi:MAG: enoyl-[acyl-carrier-protein] reductase FabK [Spirochaetia bacterium]|nr:enoyl-[acyl-carrier-protein] reductase FabK [Spirochaetia bacterium]